MMTRGLMLALLGLSQACGGKPGTADGGDTMAARPDSGAAPVGQRIPGDSTRPTLPPAIIPEDSPGVTAGATATVSHLLGSSALVGKNVRVTGTCLGYSLPSVAVGSPPRTRSDWQLESEGVAIYVTGPMPGGCSPTTRSDSPITITAQVREDTLAGLGGNPPRPRRYLEWKGP